MNILYMRIMLIPCKLAIEQEVEHQAAKIRRICTSSIIHWHLMPFHRSNAKLSLCYRPAWQILVHAEKKVKGNAQGLTTKNNPLP